MKLSEDCFNNTSTDFTNVSFVIVEDGELEITPVAVTVEIKGNSDSVPYNGAEQKVTGYEVTGITGTALITKDDIVFVPGTLTTIDGKPAAKGTDAGTYKMGLTGANFALKTGINPDNYSITYSVTDGELVINPIEATVKIEGASNSTTYDREWHQVTGYTVTEISTSLYHESDFTFNPTANVEMEKDVPNPKPIARRQDVGKTNMNLAETQFVNTNTNFSKVTFLITDGYQEITPVDEVVVTIEGNKDRVTYDGQPHEVADYEVKTISNPLYTVADFTFDTTGVNLNTEGKISVEKTDVGKYPLGLKEDGTQFKNNNTNFKKVTFNVTDGYLEITKRPVEITITGDVKNFEYDGQPHRAFNYDVSVNDSLYNEAAIKFTHAENVTVDGDGRPYVEKTDAGEYPMGLTTAQFTNTNDNFDATISVKDGKLTINKVTVTVKITGHTRIEDYNGEEWTVTGYDTAISDQKYTEADFTYKGEAKAVGTDAGKYPMGLDTEDFVNNNNNFDVTFELVSDGLLTINKIDIIVDIEGKKDQQPYNGTEQSVSGYEIKSISNILYKETDIKFTPDENVTIVDGKPVAKGTNVGTYPMNLTSAQFSNTNTKNFGTVTFNVIDGEMKITPIDVVVTIVGANNVTDYDAQEHKVTGYTATADTNLYDVDNDFTFTGTAEAKRTDVGTEPMNLAADQFTNTNTNFGTVTFNVTDGYQTINPIDVTVTITGHYNVAVYDGEEHKVTGYDVAFSNTVYKETDFTFTGTAEAKRTEVGTTEMGLAADQFTNVNTNFGTVTFNVTDGYQTITPVDTVVVTIVGNKNTTDYDGEEHSVQGYTVEISDPLYKETDFTFSGTATASRTNVGTTNMGLKADQFTNTNTNFKDVVFNVTDGYQAITPIAVTVTVVGNKDEKFYNGQNQKVVGFTATSTNNLYKVTGDTVDFTFSGTDTAEGKDVNTYPMGLAADQFTNTNENFSTVTFVITDGELKINPLRVSVDVIGNVGEEMYDGHEKKVEGYTVNAPTATEVSGGDASAAVDPTTLFDNSKVTFSGEAVAKGTLPNNEDNTAYPDHYPMNLKAEQFGYSDNNLIVTFNVVDGKLVIKDRVDGREFKVKAITDDATKEYSGKTWIGSDFTYRVEAVSANGLSAFLNKAGELISNILGLFKVHAADTDVSKEVEIGGVKFYVSGLRVDVNGRNVGQYTLNIVDLNQFKVVDALGNDVTRQFAAPTIETGTLTITPKKMVVTSLSASKVYDGTALYNHSAFADTEWGEGDAVAYNFTGSQTEVGVSDNLFTVQPANSATLLSNYDITYVYGKLEVTKQPESKKDDPDPDDDDDDDDDDEPKKPKKKYYDDNGDPNDDNPTVLGDKRPADDGKAVLGEKREQEEKKVLGARRGGTEDSTNTSRVIVLLIAAGAVATLLATGKKRKETEEK
ncbi:hypothetical protein [Butyrivibrio sp. VCD2006]|uniref:hypothetical protein n=1 Tax=Butyrivibrio sp. VCD2006 TaxID=1280664 RepID=UPI0003F587DB|nr:hypothetical protein [Butyrivibrio sp. VCD2006]